MKHLNVWHEGTPEGDNDKVIANHNNIYNYVYHMFWRFLFVNAFITTLIVMCLK